MKVNGQLHAPAFNLVENSPWFPVGKIFGGFDAVSEGKSLLFAGIKLQVAKTEAR